MEWEVIIWFVVLIVLCVCILIGCIDIGIFGVIDRLSNEIECTVCIGGYYCDF